MDYLSGLDLSDFSVARIRVPKVNSEECEEKVRISWLTCDKFLREMPPVYMSLAENEGVLYGAIFSYKRNLLHDFQFELCQAGERLGELIESLKAYKACIGVDELCGNALSDKFNDETVRRHPKCLVVVKGDNCDDNDDRCDMCCESKRKARQKAKKLSAEKDTNLEKAKQQCDQCDMEFKSRELLRQHVRRKHFGRERFVCPVEGCTSSFTRKDSLQVHEKSHSGPPKFVCVECGAFFIRKGSLDEHVRRSHVAEAKNWLCADCDKTFFCRQQLERHRRIHLGDKPYACLDCGKAFNRSHHLLNHVKSQHPENPQQKTPKRRRTKNEITTKIEYEVIDEAGNVHTVAQVIPINHYSSFA